MDIQGLCKGVFPTSGLDDLIGVIGVINMRDKFATVAAIFVPLGFLGGILQGSIGVAIGSAIIWAIIFLIVRPRI